MLDSSVAQLAMRNRARGLSVATTGSTTLVATTTGYTRASGSFLTDGFVVGVELLPAGFSTNNPDVITAVSALSITTANTHTAQASGSGRTLSVGLPSLRSWEGIGIEPTEGLHFLEEEWVPATSEVITLPASSGTMQEAGLYVLRWYGLQRYGSTPIRKCVDALRALFTPGTNITAGASTVRIGTPRSASAVGPTASQILPDGKGWLACTVRIPWWSQTTNVVAA